MAADTKRNCVVNAGSRGGVVAVGVGMIECLRRRLKQQQHCHRRRRRPSPRARRCCARRCHPLVAGTKRAACLNTVSRKTTCVVVMSLPLRGPSSTSRR
eukprot:3945146-Pleurochrysis_carterae.AAC.1